MSCIQVLCIAVYAVLVTLYALSSWRTYREKKWGWLAFELAATVALAYILVKMAVTRW